jgi:hypothetical protein
MHDHTDSMPMTGFRRSRSYLLRLWQEEPASPWRALLRCVTTHEEHLFHDMEGLVRFLKMGVCEREATIGGRDEIGPLPSDGQGAAEVERG